MLHEIHQSSDEEEDEGPLAEEEETESHHGGLDDCGGDLSSARTIISALESCGDIGAAVSYSDDLLEGGSPDRMLLVLANFYDDKAGAASVTDRREVVLRIRSPVDAADLCGYHCKTTCEFHRDPLALTCPPGAEAMCDLTPPPVIESAVRGPRSILKTPHLRGRPMDRPAEGQSRPRFGQRWACGTYLWQRPGRRASLSGTSAGAPSGARSTRSRAHCSGNPAANDVIWRKLNTSFFNASDV